MGTVRLEDPVVDVVMGAVPVEDPVVDVVMAEKVVSDKAIPIMTNATTAVVIESFRFAVIIPTQIPCKVSFARTYSTMQFSRNLPFTFCLNKFLCYLLNIDTHPAIHLKNTKTSTITLRIRGLSR